MYGFGGGGSFIKGRISGYCTANGRRIYFKNQRGR